LKTSAGLLVYRFREGTLEVFIAHMGGPLWAKKDKRSWSIPKGELDPGEKPLEAALREFREETGMEPPHEDLLNLGEFQQSSKKKILIWASEGDLDPEALVSNRCEIEWPPRSGRTIEIPEVDRAEWCDIPTASDRVIKGQVQVLEALEKALAPDSTQT
jgi:predicted NUDIX family NTP pyrophosphohydrolase